MFALPAMNLRNHVAVPPAAQPALMRRCHPRHVHGNSEPAASGAAEDCARTDNVSQGRAREQPREAEVGDHVIVGLLRRHALRNPLGEALALDGHRRDHQDIGEHHHERLGRRVCRDGDGQREERGSIGNSGWLNDHAGGRGARRERRMGGGGPQRRRSGEGRADREAAEQDERA